MKNKTNRPKVLNIDDIILRLVETPNIPEKNCVIKEGEVQGLCAMARQVMLDQPMLLQLEAPVQICGDIHGQFSDLITIFKIFGSPEHKNYLFLGDYVDRGKQSLECILLLLAYKIRYPNKFFLLRGNHQSMELNKLYGFFDQCKRRLTIRAWKVITDTFNCLPVAAVVGGRIFCVHGGLSPQIKTLDMLNTIRRPVQILDNRIITDILWADPKPSIDGWNQNYERGVSYYYGTNVVDFFLKRNDFDLICRSHQVVEEGYEFAFDRKLITIFSSPNYCGEFQNLAAVLKIASDLTCRIEQFEGAPIQAKKRGRSVTPIRGGLGSWKENSSPRKSREPSVSPSKERKSQEISTVKQRKATKIGSNYLAKNSAPNLMSQGGPQ